jgi:hypothetical protein
MGKRISNKYLKMSKIYSIFSSEWKDDLDFSEKSLKEMYDYESRGVPVENTKDNGFYVGKQYMDVHITMWRKDLREGLITRKELYEDGRFPKWWLNKVI